MSRQQRVSVLGASGCGKTTFGRALAGRLGVPFIELDALYHGPGWSEPEPEQFQARVRDAMGDGGWVIDGSYRRVLGDDVLLAADTVVWLDPPAAVMLTRLLRRTGSRMVRRTELWAGNRESLRGAFWGRESLFGWAIRTHRLYRRTLPGEFARPPLDAVTMVRLRSAAQAGRWLDARR